MIPREGLPVLRVQNILLRGFHLSLAAAQEIAAFLAFFRARVDVLLVEQDLVLCFVLNVVRRVFDVLRENSHENDVVLHADIDFLEDEGLEVVRRVVWVVSGEFDRDFADFVYAKPAAPAE